MMLHAFYKRPSLQWALLAVLLLAYPALIILVKATGRMEWLTLALLPAVAGLLSCRLAIGNSLMVFTILFFWIAGIAEEDASVRSAMLFHIPVLILASLFVFLYRHRLHEQELGCEKFFAELEERLILMREQYKTDLLVNVSDQKKFQKYSLLHRVSRVIGSQLQLEKLADKIMKEVREIIGAERGRFFLAIDFSDKSEPLVKGLPEDKEIREIMHDQYGAWTTLHRSTLLVSDTNDDFRFQALGPNTMIRSVMLAPLQMEGRLLGVLRAESPWAEIFTKDDVRLFTIIADLASVAIENARLYQYAQELAITDGLTGLYLRRFFNQRLEEELSRYREHGTPFSLCLMDLDHFKRVNDRMGHLAGDQVLAQFGETLRSEARVADLLCRFGGEEFALLLPNTNIEGTLVMAERIRARVAQREFIANGEIVRLTVSGGIGECPRHGENMNELIRVTDAALYLAKSSGRNRIVIAGGAR
ncbi:sensor domain-containing diguanylate cyclase [candidate division FCPU426 bacterium]|nr:sensor domain-containing diguanylate cyclase [candidate division FCPU426 bacterium]